MAKPPEEFDYDRQRPEVEAAAQAAVEQAEQTWAAQDAQSARQPTRAGIAARVLLEEGAERLLGRYYERRAQQDAAEAAQEFQAFHTAMQPTPEQRAAIRKPAPEAAAFMESIARPRGPFRRR